MRRSGVMTRAESREIARAIAREPLPSVVSRAEQMKRKLIDPRDLDSARYPIDLSAVMIDNRDERRDFQRSRVYKAQARARAELAMRGEQSCKPATDAELVALFDELRSNHEVACSLKLDARRRGAVAWKMRTGGHPRIELGGMRSTQTLLHEFAHVLCFVAQRAGLISTDPAHGQTFVAVYVFLLLRYLGGMVAARYVREFTLGNVRMRVNDRLLGAIIGGSQVPSAFAP